MIRALLIFLFPLSAVASPAIELACRGYDSNKDAAAEFTVLYADWDRATGYGTQTLTLTKLGTVAVNEVYNLHDVVTNCPAALSVNKLELTNTASGVWKAVYNRACGPDAQYSIKATCEDL